MIWADLFRYSDALKDASEIEVTRACDHSKDVAVSLTLENENGEEITEHCGIIVSKDFSDSSIYKKLPIHTDTKIISELLPFLISVLVSNTDQR